MSKAQPRPVKEAVIWGIISLAAYLLVFLNQGAVINYFAQGGVASLALIATAIAFSLIHGTFANYFLESLGIRPLKKGGH
ncbi:hypothetical protein [Desulfovirgula thermocuniculi]|uniref:hypothetical protein n=1 Tax=Desulfovirgula thermocuniculi TaxID=348842 RepID=UPI0004215BE5|nr:hypothetical protein [Desulfovirgula thermocuniculi]